MRKISAWKKSIFQKIDFVDFWLYSQGVRSKNELKLIYELSEYVCFNFFKYSNCRFWKSWIRPCSVFPNILRYSDSFLIFSTKKKRYDMIYSSFESSTKVPQKHIKLLKNKRFTSRFYLPQKNIQKNTQKSRKRVSTSRVDILINIRRRELV